MPIEVTNSAEKIWKPNPGKQEEFLSLPDTIFEGFYGGALGAGKTEILVMLPIARQFYLHPKFNAVIFRRNFPELEKDIIPLTKEYYPILGAKYNDTKHTWTFPSGARIALDYIDTYDDVKRHDGSEYNYVAFDELEHFLKEMYIYIAFQRTRTTSKREGLPTIIRSTGMPGGVGHTWVRERFIDPCPDGGKIVISKVGGKEASKTIFIKARMQDNPVLMKDDPDYINRLRSLSAAEYDAKVNGNWFAFLGQVFKEFRFVRYPDEPENAIHVIEPFDIPDWWPKIAAIDWGYEHKTAIHKAAISPDGRTFVYDELISRREYISTWASNFKCRTPESLSIVTMDPSAWQKRGDAETIADQFMACSGMIAQKADNDRIGGKMLYHEMLRWQPRPPRYIPKEGFDIETSHKLLRLYGEKAQKGYEKMFIPDKPETNIPKVQIFKTCPDLIKTIPTLIYDEKKPEDVAKIDGDDSYDSTRYLFKEVERYLLVAENAAKAREERGRILDDFQINADQTAFYRRLEHLEFKQKGLGKRIRLFH